MSIWHWWEGGEGPRRKEIVDRINTAGSGQALLDQGIVLNQRSLGMLREDLGTGMSTDAERRAVDIVISAMGLDRIKRMNTQGYADSLSEIDPPTDGRHGKVVR